MNTVREVIDNWTARILAKPDEAENLNASFKLNVSGEGGGQWVLNCKNPVGVVEGDGEADCSLSLSGSDLIEMASGNLNPQLAFLEGRLSLDGDISQALKLTPFLL